MTGKGEEEEEGQSICNRFLIFDFLFL
uniref:Uncharacterized protein n=1 Tax=Arundo donax TaxID=35708 RepID=A0A0A8ZSB8_ARUDO